MKNARLHNQAETSGRDNRNSNQDIDYAATPGGEISVSIVDCLTRGGHTVKQSTDGAYWVSKFGLSRYCESLSDLQEFAQKVGVLSKFSSPIQEYVNLTEKTNLPPPRS
jgi:hypothetical protein